ncbi:MAG: hypothetical protein QOJ16_4849, partial [Acidobacteriota bacterium]|nr:hypothetical protein [Acidobacteriota bacterium]
RQMGGVISSSWTWNIRISFMNKAAPASEGSITEVGVLSTKDSGQMSASYLYLYTSIATRPGSLGSNRTWITFPGWNCGTSSREIRLFSIFAS